MVGLAPGHDIITQHKTITKVDFETDGEKSRLDNKPSGKGKRGAQFLNENATLCVVECSDGSKYRIAW
jgi:hypothetical protein